MASGLPERVERLRLPVAPLEREGEHPPGALAERVLRDERTEVGRHPRGLAGMEAGLRQVLHGGQPELLQAGRFGCHRGGVTDVGVGRAAPEVEGAAQEVGGGARVAGGQRRTPFVREPHEQVGIDPDGARAQDVPR